MSSKIKLDCGKPWSDKQNPNTKALRTAWNAGPSLYPEKNGFDEAEKRKYGRRSETQNQKRFKPVDGE